jgi:hypothetical protein
MTISTLLFGGLPPGAMEAVGGICFGVFIAGAVILAAVWWYIGRKRPHSSLVSGNIPLWIAAIGLSIPCLIYLVWLLAHFV